MMLAVRATTRLRVRIFGVVLAGALVVAFGVSLLLGNTIAQRNRNARDQRLDRDLVSVIALERLTVDAETGLRGYVITQIPLFLAPTRTAQAELVAAVAAVRATTQLEPGDRTLAAQLIAATERYFTDYLPAVLPLVIRRPAVARSVSVTAEGKHEVDVIRARTASLEHSLTAQTAGSERAAHHSADEAVAEAIAVLVALTALTLVLGGYLGRLAVQRDQARQRSESTARTLQQSLLPTAVPEVPGLELAVRFAPAGAGDLVGGDFYDVFAHRPDVWSIVLGDVCGKGAEAAAVTAMARWTLRSLAGSEIAPGAALRFLNDAMLRQDLAARFITVALLSVAVDPGQARITVACAGHPAPVLVPADDGPAEPIAASGDLLGVWPTIRLRGAEVTLQPGDGIVLYTDGITDQGPDVREPPAAVLSRCQPGTSAEQLADALLELARRAPGRQQDDVAIIALRFCGQQSSGQARPAPVAAAADR